jgi:DNA-binding MarR family transcriptional regulator
VNNPPNGPPEPGRPPAAQDVVDQMLVLQPKLQRVLESSLPVEVSLELGSVTFHQLEALACLPADGTTMRQFASSVGISGAAATALADRMIKQGLAVRRDDPTDRRTVWLAPTERAVGLLHSFRTWQRTSMSNVLGRLEPKQVAIFLEVLKALVQPEAIHE